MERNESIKKLILRNPVNRGLDYDFVKELMIDTVRKHFPELQKINSVTHIKHKRRVGKRHSTFIYTYTISGVGSSSESIEKKLVYSSHSDGSRKRAFDMLALILNAGFNQGDAYRVIEPLEFYEDIHTLIYEAVPGMTLYHHMKKRPPVSDLYDILRHTAAWVQKFHRYPLDAKTLEHIPPFDSFNFNWSADELRDSVNKANAMQGGKLALFLEQFRRVERRLLAGLQPSLVYGDLHPENIITLNLRPQGLTVIDFTDVVQGDQMRDIGSFIQQLYFMGTQFYTEDEANDLRKTFLELYFGCPLDAVSTNQLQRINLYQAWNSLRGFVYFFFQPDYRERSYGLLEDAWRFLNLADEGKRFFTITYADDGRWRANDAA